VSFSDFSQTLHVYWQNEEEKGK